MNTPATPDSEKPEGGGELRPLTADEVALVEAYPLPGAVPDAIVNRYQLATALDKSKNTIDAWRVEGMPVEAEGKNGRNYQFRLSLCFAWMRQREAADTAQRQQSEDAAQQLRLELIGNVPGANERARLSPKEQRFQLENEALWMNAARKRREVVHMDDLVPGIEMVLSVVRDGANALPDRAAREMGLDGRQIEILQGLCDGFLTAAAEKIQELIGDDEADDFM